MSFLSSCFASSQPISLPEDSTSSYGFLPAPPSTKSDNQLTSKQPSCLSPPSYTDAFDAASLDAISSTMRDAIDAASDGLRKVSLSIHGKPELAFKEFHASKTIVKYLRSLGFEVTAGAYGLETAFEVIYDARRKGEEGRTVGFQSEMDALPGIGQACGHNLIAISGIAAFLGTVEAIKKHNLSAKAVLLGTPAEEGGAGKVILRKAGAYDDFDATLMVHPSGYSGFAPMLSATGGSVEFRGHTAHAAGSPWEGRNALDATVIAYNGIAVLRQQTAPSFRIHALILPGDNWALNIIPDHSRLQFGLRSTEVKEVVEFLPRLLEIFEGAAKATGTTVEITTREVTKDVRQNSILASTYTEFMTTVVDREQLVDLPALGSTDFGDTSYHNPGIHPSYAIPVGLGSQNHTRGFTAAAKTFPAHLATLDASKGIAHTALKVLTSSSFAKAAKAEFDLKKKQDEEFCFAKGIQQNLSEADGRVDFARRA